MNFSVVGIIIKYLKINRTKICNEELLKKANPGEALRKDSQTSRVPREPFDPFSRISFKISPLGAELAFCNQRASFANIVEPFNFLLGIISKNNQTKLGKSTELFGGPTE